MNEQHNATQIACSLSDEAMRKRRAMLRKTLLPLITETSKLYCGLRLSFPPTQSLRSSVETFVRLERQCCGFLTFTITPPEQGLVLTIEGPPHAQATLDMIAQTISLSANADVRPQRKGEQTTKRLGRGGVAGIAAGALALLACELPIVLALIGLGGFSTAAAALKPPFFVELGGIVLGGAGLVVLVALVIRRVWIQRKNAVP